MFLSLTSEIPSDLLADINYMKIFVAYTKNSLNSGFTNRTKYALETPTVLFCLSNGCKSILTLKTQMR